MSSTLRTATVLLAAAAVAIIALVAGSGQVDAASYRTFRPAAGVKVHQISPSKVRITNRTGHAVAVRTTVRQNGGWTLTDTHYVCHNGTETDRLWGRGRVVRVHMYAHPGAGC
jgi:hypothetical protein